MIKSKSGRTLPILVAMLTAILGHLPCKDTFAESKKGLRSCRSSDRRLSLDEAYEHVLTVLKRTTGREAYQLASDMKTFLELSETLQRGECLVEPKPGMSPKELTKYMKKPLSDGALVNLQFLNGAFTVFQALGFGAETLCSTLDDRDVKKDPAFAERSQLQVYCCRVQLCSDLPKASPAATQALY